MQKQSPKNAAADGMRGELDRSMPDVYTQLHQLAASYMRNERPEHTLQPTALVHETYLRLATQHSVDFANRAQVIGVAAQLMRRVLRTYGEQRVAQKRGGEITIVCLADSPEPAATSVMFFSDVDRVLDRLAALDERQARVAELRIFDGLTIEETAEFLNISVSSANRDWASGRLWLAGNLPGGSQPKMFRMQIVEDRCGAG